MKKQNFFSSLLIGTVVLSIALPSLVSADPAGTPPGGNVDATFNSVTAGYGTTPPSIGGSFQGEDQGVSAVSTGPVGFAGYLYGANGLYSESSSASGMAAGFYNFAGSPAVGVLLGYAGDALLASGPVNLVGRIYSGSGDINDRYVNIADSDGVRFGNDAGTYALMIDGTGVLSNPIASPVNGLVSVSDANGFSVTDPASAASTFFRASGGWLDNPRFIGGLSQATCNGDSYGGLYAGATCYMPLKINDSLDLYGTAGIRNTAVIGAIPQPLIIEDDQGLQIANNGRSPQLSISGTTGDISDTTGAVTVKDDNGLELWRAGGASADITLTPAVPPKLATNHNLSLNLNSGNGTMFFLDNLGNTTLSMNSFGIWSNSVGPSPTFVPQPLKILDSQGLGIGDNAGNVRLLIDDTGDISDLNSDVMITDNMQSTGYIASGWDGTLADTSFAAIYNNGAMYGTGAIWNSPTMGGLTLNAISPGGMTLNSCLNHTDTAPVNGQCDTISGNAGFTINTQSGGQTINATTGGFTVNATSGGIALNSDTGGIANQKAGLPVRVQDNLEVSGSTLVSGNIDLRTWLYDGSDWLISVFGDFEATGAITGDSVGTYYEYENPVSAYRSGGSWFGCNAYPGVNICEKHANCQSHAGTADIPINASVSNIVGGGANAHLVQIGVNHPSSTDAQFYYYSSNAASPTGLRIKVLCFSPDGD